MLVRKVNEEIYKEFLNKFDVPCKYAGNNIDIRGWKSIPIDKKAQICAFFIKRNKMEFGDDTVLHVFNRLASEDRESAMDIISTLIEQE